MSNKSKTTSKTKAILKKQGTVGTLTEYHLSTNGLRVLFEERRGTGIVTSNILYHVGSRDEVLGKTGIAHMLEHMLFKPTKQDRMRKTISGAMHFESETGAVTNANTWKDRTTYYFSYPREHFERALRIEAERMRDVLLVTEEFTPEQTNVLSEYDMYAGNEQFALSVEMGATAFFAYPYHHETIGFRDDIARLTVEDLQTFYNRFYTPNNAVLIVIGDITESVMKKVVTQIFSNIPKGPTLSTDRYPIEPTQTGRRTVTIERKTKTNILALGVKLEGFPSPAWFETMILFELLAGGKQSMLYKALVDTGKAIRVEYSLEPSQARNLGVLSITLAPTFSHEVIEKEVLQIIKNLTLDAINRARAYTLSKVQTDEAMTRENTLSLIAELVEYVSAGKLESFFETKKLLNKCSAKLLQKRLHELFAESNMTIGYCKGIAQ